MRVKPLGWAVIVVVLVICAGGAAFAAVTGRMPWEPAATVAAPVAMATTPAVVSTPRPAATTAVPPPPEPTDTPVPTPAPTEANRQSLTVAFDSFGSYFTAIQVLQIPDRSYDLVLLPLGFGGVDFTEAERAQKLASGEWDILLMTANAFARNGNVGRIVSIVDQSAGADKIVAWPNSVTAADARPIGKFNDLKGLTIAYSAGSVGEFQMLALLRVVGLTPQDVILSPQSSVSSAVATFIDKKADAVAGWEPDINDAIGAGGTELVSSDWWRNVVDVMIASNAADANKKDALQAFLRDWYLSLKVQQDDLPKAAADIAAWQYNGQATNDWSYVFPGTEVDDLKAWLGTIAQAGLPANIVMMNNLDLLVQQLISHRAVWAWGGQLDTSIPFDPEKAIASDYVMALSKDPALRTTGEFVNNSFQPVAPEVPAADPTVLITLPTFAELPCKEFSFLPNDPVLAEESLPVLQACAQAAVDLLSVSDAQILVTGWSAWPTGYTESQIQQFARLRAIGVQTALVQLGVDPARIAILASIPPPEDQNAVNEAQMAPYRKVVIEIKRLGGR